MRAFQTALVVLLVLAVCLAVAFHFIFAPDKYHKPIVLGGTLVTPDETIRRGYVVVDGGRIQEVSSRKPDIPNSIFIDTRGIIFPGLIDLHNHVMWNVIPRWQPDRLYLNRYEWRLGNDHYQKIRTAVRNVRSEHYGDMNAFGEVRALLGGATSIVGSGSRLSVRGLVRNLDFYSGFYTIPLWQDRAHLRSSIEIPRNASETRKYLANNRSDAFFIHLAEGTGPASRAEFEVLNDLGLLTAKTAIVHGTALGNEQFKIMSDVGASLIWSPRSNIELYGETVDVLGALREGVGIAIGPDWAISGSSNMLDELRFAANWNRSRLNGGLTDKQLVCMATKNPAAIAGLSDKVGRIEEGLYADLLVIEGDGAEPYGALLEAGVDNVQLVLINGLPVYGSVEIMQSFWPSSRLADIELAETSKSLLMADFPGRIEILEQAMSDEGMQLAPLSEGGEAWLPEEAGRIDSREEGDSEFRGNGSDPSDEINWDEAKYYFGERRTVCGPVVDSYFAASDRNRETYLNLGLAHPDIHRISVVIHEEARARFPADPEKYYLGKSICVSGKIETYQGMAQMIVSEPAQIRIE